MATRKLPDYLWTAALVMVLLPGLALSAPQSEDFEAADDYGEEDTLPDEDVSSSKMPNFTSVPHHFRVRLGSSVRLPCEVDELGDYTLLWKREEGDILTAGTILISKDSRISHEGNSLVIRGIEMSDQGAYFCQIPSTQDQRELRHYIDILVPAKAQPVPSNGLIVVKKGEPVTLACEVTGNPLPVVTWTREGAKKFPDGQKTMLGNSITFPNTNRHHSGVYECTAENSEGQPSKAIINLQITYEPEIEVELSFVSIAEGYNTELTCTVHGEPRPQVTWSKNGRQIDTDPRYSHTNSGSRHVLAIDNVKTEDFGMYTCSAENRFGSDAQTIEVSGVASAATLKRKKPLTNGVELEWVTVSHTAVLEYRVRYRVQATAKWEELTLKAEETDDNMGMPKTLYSHVHQLHNLESGSDYDLSIESRNKFGWSRPLQIQFSTLQTGKAVEAGIIAGNSASRSWTATLAALVLTRIAATLLC